MEPIEPATSAVPVRLRPAEAMRRGRDTFGAHLWPSVGALLPATLISLAAAKLPSGWSHAFSVLVLPALGAGCAAYAMLTVRGEAPGFASVLVGFRRWPAVVSASLALYVAGQAIMLPATLTWIAKAGFASFWQGQSFLSAGAAAYVPIIAVYLACYVPLCWFGARTWALPYVLMEPDAPGAWTALRRTWGLTRGSAWRGVGLGAFSALVMLVGLVALCVGIIPASMVLCFAYAHGYEMLRGTEPAAANAANEPAISPAVARPVI